MNTFLYINILAFLLFPWIDFQRDLAGNDCKRYRITRQVNNDTVVTCCINPPKEIVVSKTQKYLLVSWISENIQDFDHYEMEVAVDSNHFVLSSIIPSIVDNNPVKIYNSPVYKAKTNRYLRLRMIDRNSKETVSGIIDLATHP